MDCVSVFYSAALLFLFIGLDARVLPSRSGVDNVHGVSFDQNYAVTWGQDHVQRFDQGHQVQLSMDQSSGCGFESKRSYGSGLFRMRIKLPEKDSAGVVTAFYLTSKGAKHDEVDFEFLGNREGKPITVQTNVYADGNGDREQRFLLWFDPTKHFHTYSILWNPFHVVFYVDNIPIRVFKNSRKKNVRFPSKPMQIEGSLWNGESWATDGGQTKIDWTHSPFKAHFRGFKVSGCPVRQSDGKVLAACGSSDLWWNTGKYRVGLSGDEKRAYEKVRAKYMNYDYCDDRFRFPVPPPECGLNKG